MSSINMNISNLKMKVISILTSGISCTYDLMFKIVYQKLVKYNLNISGDY